MYDCIEICGGHVNIINSKEHTYIICICISHKHCNFSGRTNEAQCRENFTTCTEPSYLAKILIENLTNIVKQPFAFRFLR